MNETKSRLPLGLAHLAFWFLCLCYLETYTQLVIFHGIGMRYGYILGFTLAIAGVLSLLTSLLPRRWNANVSTVLVCFLCVLFASQAVYYYIFGTMYSLSMIALGGKAVTNFWKEMMSSIFDHLPVLLLAFVPIVGLALTRRFAGQVFETNRNRSRPALLLCIAVLHVVLLLVLRGGGTGFYTAYSYYHGNDATTDQTAESFGLLTTFRLEFQHMFQENDRTGYLAGDEDDGQVDTHYDYNVLDIDFDALSAQTDDERIREISDYCARLTGTQKNEYTGMLSDYNLIVLCAESFSTAAIDEELTPTLWKLSHEGLVFNNYYNTFPNTTTDGEYTLCQGLFPDKTRGKTASSFYASRDSYLPMCLGNLFYEQKGIVSYGYHNNTGEYYGRQESHPNMGYRMKFSGSGMNFTTGWPSSDLEMMEQSVQDYIGQSQFHAYYMTFSGHYKYDLNNPMAIRNWDAVKDLEGYTQTEKCYLACNLELEKAMAYLMEQLETAGVADHTAIVLAGDHFPYGLTNEEYGDIIGHDVDYFEAYKDTLIFWVGGLDQPIQVDEYCCTVDVLPTILNLWGFDYDSRLLAGTDVFSGSTHIAILVDQSFLTDKVWFDTNTNTAIWLVDKSTVSPSYLDSMIRLVKNRMTISTDILNTAYYNFVFGKEAVRVNTNAWISDEAWNGTAGSAEDPVDETQEPVGSVPIEGEGEPPAGEETPTEDAPPIDGETEAPVDEQPDTDAEPDPAPDPAYVTGVTAPDGPVVQ